MAKAWPRWRVTVRRPRRHRCKVSPAMAEMDDDELLDALGVEVAPLKVSSRYRTRGTHNRGLRGHPALPADHGRAPLHGEAVTSSSACMPCAWTKLRKLPEAQTCWL
jgi:hypothetical protein